MLSARLNQRGGGIVDKFVAESRPADLQKYTAWPALTQVTQQSFAHRLKPVSGRNKVEPQPLSGEGLIEKVSRTPSLSPNDAIPAGIEKLHQADVAATLAGDVEALTALWDS